MAELAPFLLLRGWRVALPLSDLPQFVKSRTDGDLLPWNAQVEASRRFGVSAAAVELVALEAGVLPRRYQRNRTTLSVQDQLALFRSRAAVIGCGGLGGYVIEELARLGVGHLVLVDPDVFEEHNLNRQLLSSPELVGAAKADAGGARVAYVNPAVTVAPHRAAFSSGNARELLGGCSVVVDALDNVLTRRELAVACRDLSVPLVHGAIAGWFGQVSVQMPGGDILPLLRPTSGGKGVETALGNPSFTPAVIASIQVAEVVKILLGRGKPLAGRVLMADLLEMRFEEIPYA